MNLHLTLNTEYSLPLCLVVVVVGSGGVGLLVVGSGGVGLVVVVGGGGAGLVVVIVGDDGVGLAVVVDGGAGLVVGSNGWKVVLHIRCGTTLSDSFTGTSGVVCWRDA